VRFVAAMQAKNAALPQKFRVAHAGGGDAIP
jgi:hypothetical protein